MQALLAIPPASRSLSLDPPLSDDEFEELCFANDFFQLERTREGEILMNAPAGGMTGDGNSEIIYQLRAWWKTRRTGRVFDSNTGFFLPDGAMFSPDAAYLSPAKLKSVTQAQAERLFRLTPDFVIELASKTDSLKKTMRKMELWIANGVELGWLIDPYRKQALVYQPGAPVRTESGLLLEGTGPVHGFNLDLAEVWSCYRIDH